MNMKLQFVDKTKTGFARYCPTFAATAQKVKEKMPLTEGLMKRVDKKLARLKEASEKKEKELTRLRSEVRQRRHSVEERVRGINLYYDILNDPTSTYSSQLTNVINMQGRVLHDETKALYKAIFNLKVATFSFWTLLIPMKFLWQIGELIGSSLRYIEGAYHLGSRAMRQPFSPGRIGESELRYQRFMAALESKRIREEIDASLEKMRKIVNTYGYFPFKW